MMRDFQCFFPLQCSKIKTSPRLWIAIVLTFLIAGGMALDYNRVAEYMNEGIQICETAIMFFSYRVTFMFYIFGLCLILSDAPFWDENTIYYISRMSGKRWMLCVFKYIFVVSLLYTVFISSVGVLFTIGRVAFSTEWSASAQAVAYDEVFIGQGQGVYFSDMVLKMYSPYGAFFRQMILIVLYGYFMGSIVTIYNITFRSNAGFVAAVSLHALMLVISLDNLPVFKHFSLYNYASITTQRDGTSFLLSVIILIVIDIAISFYGLRAIRKADISTTTMEWIS